MPRYNPVSSGTGGLLWALCLLLAAGCVPAPENQIAEHAISEHFRAQGYTVAELAIGDIRRNPVAEREYMAPLTYVVEIRSISLEVAGVPAARSGEHGNRQFTFSGAAIKIRAAGQGQSNWEVSQVSGIDLP